MNARMVTRGSALAMVVAGPLWIVGSARADYHLMSGGSGEFMLFMFTNATPPLLLLVGFSGLRFYARKIGRSNQFLTLSFLGAGAACPGARSGRCRLYMERVHLWLLPGDSGAVRQLATLSCPLSCGIFPASDQLGPDGNRSGEDARLALVGGVSAHRVGCCGAVRFSLGGMG